jgi:hypothetical protein
MEMSGGGRGPRFRRIAVKITLSLLAAGLSLAACSTFGHHGDHEGGAEANAYPANYRPDLIAFMQSYLNNPSGVRDAQIAEPALKPVGSSQRYVVCIKYNARNKEGAYLGVKESAAVYLRGRFNQLVDATDDTCKGALYQPFPELMSLTR